MVALTYASIGDANGAIYWLGTDGYTKTFANPYPNKIGVSGTPGWGAGYGPETTVDRNQGTGWTPPGEPPVMEAIWDFKNLRLTPNHYTIRGRTSYDYYHPRSWKMQGSNTSATGPWTDLVTHTNDTTLTGGTSAGQWSMVTPSATKTVNSSGNPYRYIRFLSILTTGGPGGNDVPQFAEIEFYGLLEAPTLALPGGTGTVVVSAPTATLTAESPEPEPVEVLLAGLSSVATSAPTAVLRRSLALLAAPSVTSTSSPAARLARILTLTSFPAAAAFSSPSAVLTVTAPEPEPEPEPEEPGTLALTGTTTCATSAPPAHLTSSLSLTGLSTTRVASRPSLLSRLRRLSGIDPTGVDSPPAVISVALALTAAPSTAQTSTPAAALALVGVLDRRSTGLDRQFLHLMPHTVLVERKTGQDRYGRETYSDPRAFPARIRYTQRIMRTPDGEEIVTSGQVTIGGISGITSDDRITLPAPGALTATAPDAEETFSPLIVSVHRASDEHTDVFERVSFA